ncbi:MAG: D-aminoacyl-tRNA deacylase [Gemmatimonadota bacterium]
MRAVVQRVSRATVRVEGRVAGEIGRGLLVLVGFTAGDADDQLRWMAQKIHGLRLFADAEGRMNLGLEEVRGELLVVSQFTLYGEVERGRRPSFVRAAPAEEANRLYHRFLDLCRTGTIPVAAGEFGALMEVELVNDGPVTLWMER